MAAERVAVRQVEDELGKGFFQTTIEQGGLKRQDRVPAIYIGGGYEARQAYIQQQLDTGIPVVAYRAGERGQCVVVVNHGVVAVETARRFDTSKTGAVSLARFKWTDLNPADNSAQLIDSFSRGPNTPQLEFTGASKQTGTPIKITIGFVR